MEHKTQRIVDEKIVSTEHFLRLSYTDTPSKNPDDYPINCGNCGEQLTINAERTRYCNPCMSLPKDHVRGAFYPSD